MSLAVSHIVGTHESILGLALDGQIDPATAALSQLMGLNHYLPWSDNLVIREVAGYWRLKTTLVHALNLW